MFAAAALGGSGLILVARPSASSGTITNAANAYDLPSSRADDPPYTTSADRALVTGSTTAGTPEYVTVEYTTFPSKSKTNFSLCSLVIGVSVVLNYTLLASGVDAVTSGLDVEYQIDGTNWIAIKNYDRWAIGGKGSYGGASNSVLLPGPYYPSTVGAPYEALNTKETLSVAIPASSFPSNLNSLKVRFVLGTCKNSTVTTYQSSGSYQIWDIRANIS